MKKSFLGTLYIVMDVSDYNHTLMYHHSRGGQVAIEKIIMKYVI